MSLSAYSSSSSAISGDLRVPTALENWRKNRMIPIGLSGAQWLSLLDGIKGSGDYAELTARASVATLDPAFPGYTVRQTLMDRHPTVRWNRIWWHPDDAPDEAAPDAPPATRVRIIEKAVTEELCSESLEELTCKESCPPLECPSLQLLTVGTMDGLRLKELALECPNLQQLKISQCDIPASTWQEVAFRELRILHVAGAEHMDIATVQSLLKNCPNLLKVVLPSQLRTQVRHLEKPGLSLTAWI